MKRLPMGNILPREYTIAIKGILSLFIVGTHLCSTCMPGEATLWLRLCSALTPLALSLFFFFSGVGLMAQLQSRSVHQDKAGSSYWHGWLRRRLWGLLKPFLFFFVLAYLLQIVAIGVNTFTMEMLFSWLKQSFEGLRHGLVGPPYPAWFLAELSFLYVFFYLSFRWTRSWWLSISILVGLTIGLTACISQLGFDSYWMRYPLCFSVGVAFSRWEGLIQETMRRYRVSSSLITIAFAGLYILGIARPSHQQGFDINLYQLSLLLLPVLLIGQSKNLGITDLFMANQERRVGQALLFLGGISLEIYLLHMSFVELFHSPVLYIHSLWGYTLATYAATLVGAALIARYLHSLVRG